MFLLRKRLEDSLNESSTKISLGKLPSDPKTLALVVVVIVPNLPGDL